MTMTKTLMILAELIVVNWALIVAASLIKVKAWKPSGMMAAMGNRETQEDCNGFPARTDRAARNMLENMVLFSALVLVASVGGVANPNVELGARIFFWARLAYIPIYMVGIPVARTGVWAISVIGMGMIFASIVQSLPAGV
ncbi:MAG: MAPEG family protein [Betaproteobacteria bacterium]